jgi:hypothetical protein
MGSRIMKIDKSLSTEPRWTRDACRWLPWWLILGLAGGLISPVSPAAEAEYWSLKLRQIEYSIPIAVAGWLLFITLQQAWNRRRSKSILWANAFLAWFLVRFVAFLAMR